jgi:hypothetical protein
MTPPVEPSPLERILAAAYDLNAYLLQTASSPVPVEALDRSVHYLAQIHPDLPAGPISDTIAMVFMAMDSRDGALLRDSSAALVACCGGDPAAIPNHPDSGLCQALRDLADEARSPPPNTGLAPEVGTFFFD